MSDFSPKSKSLVRIIAALFGAGLLAYLVIHAGSDKLLQNAKTIGWGIVLVVSLAGISHLVKTWAWRLTLPGVKTIRFSRMLGLRLVSEAIGQFGFIGQVVGDATRASLLSSEMEASGVISSVALDRGLFMMSGLVVMMAGLVAVVFIPAASPRLRIAAACSGVVLLGLLWLSVVAVRRGWPVLSSTASLARRLPGLKNWLQRKESVILSVEEQLLQFHSRTPGAFWMSTGLNFVAHGLAVAEIYLILTMMGARVSVLGAVVLEALTKLINVIAALIPGALGAYEGGNMAIVKLVGLTGAEGLTLGLSRRFRAVFWAIVGGICLLYFSRTKRYARSSNVHHGETESNLMATESAKQNDQPAASFSKAAIIVANQPGSESDLRNSILAKVGALPVLLRSILSVKQAGADRIFVLLDPLNAIAIRRRLAKTKRLPDSVESLDTVPGSQITDAVRDCAPNADRVVLIDGGRSFHPSLYRAAIEREIDGAVEFTSDHQPIGLTVLSHMLANEFALQQESCIHDMNDVHAWIHNSAARAPRLTTIHEHEVTGDMWQAIATKRDLECAEKKLDGWLVKPTDGIFARMNRRVSIPISRQLIKLPITPNMVSLFTLGVSFASGVYFSRGGYWNVLVGAILSVWASILDGSDGEVARLKLQTSDFGAWLEMYCDYLYYIFVLVGMTVGLVRSTGNHSYITWGAMLLFGAIATFIFAALGRKRLSGKRPEQYLAVWHKRAESRMSNPLAYLGRHLEFIVRRCFMPYAILAFALLNLIWIPVCVGAIGANLAWIISGYALITFSRQPAISGGIAADSASPVSV